MIGVAAAFWPSVLARKSRSQSSYRSVSGDFTTPKSLTNPTTSPSSFTPISRVPPSVLRNPATALAITISIFSSLALVCRFHRAEDLNSSRSDSPRRINSAIGSFGAECCTLAATAAKMARIAMVASRARNNTPGLHGRGSSKVSPPISIPSEMPSTDSTMVLAVLRSTRPRSSHLASWPNA